jgi:hypothetical protein
MPLCLVVITFYQNKRTFIATIPLFSDLLILNSAIRTFHVLRAAVQLLRRWPVSRLCRRMGDIGGIRCIGLQSDIDEDSQDA